MAWFKRLKNGSGKPSNDSEIVTALKTVTYQNDAITPPKKLAIKEKFLASLSDYEHDQRSSDELLAAIDGLLEIEPSSGAWMLETLTGEKVKGTLAPHAFDDLEQRIKTVLDALEDQSTAAQTSTHNRTDDDTEIEGDAVTDEDTVVDLELWENNETKAINTLAEINTELSTAVSIPTGIKHQDPIKAEGDTINDRYEITECIGSGGMSKVYKAVDRHKAEAGDPNPIVAVKILNRRFTFLEDWPHILQREAEKCQALFHPNIVEVFDFGHDGSTVYMVMEYLTGQSLGTKIQNLGFKAMAPDEVQHIINEIGRALSFAHLHGVVHCDLKPANVIVNYLGEVKVIDFGIAQAFQNVNETDSDSRFRGAITPIYASPEMLEHKDSDPRDDVFSLACTAYQLITGRHPFNRMPATEARDIGTRLKRPRKLLGPQWRALRDALSFDRDKRTKSVTGFLEAFTAYAIPWKPAVAVAAGIVAVAVIGLLVTNQNLIGGIADFGESQVAPTSSAQSEATPVEQSVRQPLVSKVSKPTAEQQSAVVPPSPSNLVAQTQALERPSSTQSPDEEFQQRGQRQAEQSDKLALQSTRQADLGLTDENPQPKPASQTVSKQKSAGETSSLSATTRLDQDLNPQQGYVQSAVGEQNPIDTENTSTAQLSQTHLAAVKPAEETDKATNVTEFSSIASVTQTERTRDEIDPREHSTAQELNESLDAALGDRQETPEEQTQTTIVHSEQSLFQGAKYGDLQKIDSIIQSGFPLDTRDQRSGATAIIMASRHGHTDVVKALLDAGADAQTKDNQNMTALLWATDGGHFGVVNLLSDRNVDIEVRNDAGETALLAAAWYGYEDMVGSLLSNGADVDARNNDGWSALINASINGHLTIVRELLDAGADPSLTSYDGKTALMAAAWNGHTDIVRLLSTNSSAVNKANADGWTALMNAAWNGHRDVVKILVNSGADVQTVNADNQTAAVLAVSQGHRDIATLLKRAR